MAVKLKIGFDLDGTLYDTLDHFFLIDRQVRNELGYMELSREFYRKRFQTEDWVKLCLDLGIKEWDIKAYRNKLEARMKTMGLPELIPGAKAAVKKARAVAGIENLHIVTNNRNPEALSRRFERDGFGFLSTRTHSPHEGKSDALFTIAMEDPSSEFIYVGDLISDGRACELARGRGAANIRFCAITHQYAMNLPEMLEDYACGCKHAFTIKSINEIGILLGKKP